MSGRGNALTSDEDVQLIRQLLAERRRLMAKKADLKEELARLTKEINSLSSQNIAEKFNLTARYINEISSGKKRNSV